MQWITTLLGATRAKILDRVRRSAASVPDLAEQVGVTGNAVRGHVAALQRDGLVKRAGSSASTGGKPAQLYEITSHAEELYPKAYAAVLGAVLQEFHARNGRDATIELLRDVGRSVARQRGESASTPEGKIEAAAEALRALGAEVAVVELEDGWELRGVACPIRAVVLEQPTACSLTQALIAEVAGAEVVECCERNGERARCVFRVLAGSRSAQASQSAPARHHR